MTTNIKNPTKYSILKIKVNLDGKSVLITGCNSGLGKAVAKYMALKGARIIMACRNLETAEKTKGLQRSLN